MRQFDLHGQFRKYIHSPLFWLVLLAMSEAFLLRWQLGQLRSVVWDQNSYYDEVLMLLYSNLPAHFDGSQETAASLLKTLSFPWLLSSGGTLGIDINTMLSLLWLTAALCSGWLIWKGSRRWGWALFAYFLVLFHPVGFEAQTGVHFYRNLIIAPSFFILFAMLGLALQAFWKSRKNCISSIGPSIGLALIWPFVYYIKEDGSWSTMVMAAFALLFAAGILWNRKRIRPAGFVISLLCLILPFASFGIQTYRYKAANEKAFGYSDITLRTGGSLKRLVEDIYTIDSSNRDFRHWVPWDALEQAAAVSPALQQYPELLEFVRNHPWFVNDEVGIGADFLPWGIITTLDLTGRYPGAAKVDEILGQAADEVEAAIADGRLQKSSRLQITSSAGGRTPYEIMMLIPDVLRLYGSALFMLDWNSQSPEPLKDDYQQLLEESIPLLGTDLRYPQTAVDLNNMHHKMALTDAITECLFWIYRIIDLLLLILGVYLWFRILICGLKERRSLKTRQWTALAYVFLVTGISLAYGIGITWFVQSLFGSLPLPSTGIPKLIFYGSGIIPMILLPILYACSMKIPVAALKKKMQKRQMPKSSK